jgi:hypothetical protein
MDSSPIVVSYRGHYISWNEGVLNGPAELLEVIRYRAQKHDTVKPYYCATPLEADLSDPKNRVGAVAALVSINPGQVNIVRIDSETLNAIKQGSVAA